MQTEPHPAVLVIARALLLVLGFSILAGCTALYFFGVEATFLTWLLAISIGILLIVSACFDSASGVVATIIIFFYPLS
ncbi:hypothetical protein [Duganella levis]|uniref:Uncharacterized protein n=1 Tax=Duganella levis TaxID=2692169 RepID=A0ABW9W6P2_9BURK|nr:hypothetical protein [Duganella levis]MYN29643.1 hypothetical protein [Duganella levis]